MSSKVFISTWISRPATTIRVKEATAPIIQAKARPGRPRGSAVIAAARGGAGRNVEGQAGAGGRG
jgi:hypothetical protein